MERGKKDLWPYHTINDQLEGTHCVITHDIDGDGKLEVIANMFQ